MAAVMGDRMPDPAPYNYTEPDYDLHFNVPVGAYAVREGDTTWRRDKDNEWTSVGGMTADDHARVCGG